MASFLAYIPIVNRLVARRPAADAAYPPLDLAPVETHDVETAAEKRSRTLKHLLRANHANHAIIYHNLQFNNHMPHILCSAYLLGADSAHLYKIYEAESKELEPWRESPEEVTEDDWRTFLGDSHFQRAYVDFFEDALRLRFGCDWKKTVQEYLLSGEEPLVNCLVAGLGHPLIQLGYAYELNSEVIAMEALGMAACQYNHLHKYNDDPSYTKPSSFSSDSPRELLDRLASDDRAAGISRADPFEEVEVTLMHKHESLLLEYWNAWTIGNDATAQFRASQEAAVDLLVATVAPGTHAYNFFLVHVLTTSHAVRVLLPVVPARFRVKLVRQWWLLTLIVYLAEKRPQIHADNIDRHLQGRTWKYVEDKALRSPWATDSHYVKAVRSMKEAARTWGDVDDGYLAAAIRFVDDFQGWVF